MTNNELNQPKRFLAMSNEAYDWWNRIVTAVLPAGIVFYSTLSTIWGWANTDKVTLSVGALIVLGKALLTASKKAYIESDADKDGTIDIDPLAGEVTRFDLTTTDVQSVNKGTITLKVREARVQD